MWFPINYSTFQSKASINLLFFVWKSIFQGWTIDANTHTKNNTKTTKCISSQKLKTHLVSAVVHGCLSWALAASQCLHLSPAPQRQGTGAETETEAGAGTETGTGTEAGTGTGTETVTGSLTQLLIPDRGLLSPRKLLVHRYLQQRRSVSCYLSC